MTTKDVLALALEALKLAEESLGSFVSDHGWSQSDMDNLDTVSAAITAIKQAQEPKVKLIPTAEEMGTPMQAQAITPETGNAAPPEASAITAGNGQAQEPVERVYDAIEECLLNHRLHNFMGDDGDHYPLVDHLSHGDSIEDGRHEIRLICDSIYNTVLKPAQPAPMQAEPEATDFGHGYDVGYEAGRLHASAPEGYKRVPVELTREMLYAIQNDCDIMPQRGKRIWATLLAVAPTLPEAK